jgi:UDP-N-acetylmuramyl tripeptide synthase
VQYGKQRFAVESPLIGKINVYNILAACGAGISYGLAPESDRARHRRVASRAGAVRASG